MTVSSRFSFAFLFVYNVDGCCLILQVYQDWSDYLVLVEIQASRDLMASQAQLVHLAPLVFKDQQESLEALEAPDLMVCLAYLDYKVLVELLDLLEIQVPVDK
jgi:hypothetical protein